MDCDKILHPGKTCNGHGMNKMYLIALSYGKLFFYVRLIPGLITIIIKAVKMVIAKYSKKSYTKTKKIDNENNSA